MSRHDANRLTYDEVMIFGIPALFTDLRVDRSTVPDGVYRYNAMQFCYKRYRNSCEIKNAVLPSCAFLVESKQYAYMLRCTLTKGDYNFYMYCYQRTAFEKYRAQLKNKAHSHAKKRAEPER